MEPCLTDESQAPTPIYQRPTQTCAYRIRRAVVDSCSEGIYAWVTARQRSGDVATKGECSEESEVSDAFAGKLELEQLPVCEVIILEVPPTGSTDRFKWSEAIYREWAHTCTRTHAPLQTLRSLQFLPIAS